MRINRATQRLLSQETRYRMGESRESQGPIRVGRRQERTRETGLPSTPGIVRHDLVPHRRGPRRRDPGNGRTQAPGIDVRPPTRTIKRTCSCSAVAGRSSAARRSLRPKRLEVRRKLRKSRRAPRCAPRFPKRPRILGNLASLRVHQRPLDRCLSSAHDHRRESRFLPFSQGIRSVSSRSDGVVRRSETPWPR